MKFDESDHSPSLVVEMPKSMDSIQCRCTDLYQTPSRADSDTSAAHNGKRFRKCDGKLLAKLVLVFIFTTLSSGCAVGPNFATPTPPVLPPSYVLMGNDTGVPLDMWWQVFADEKLNALVSQGYANNLDARIAWERVIEARSNLQLVSASRAPTVSTINEYEYSLRSQNAQPFAGSNAQSPFDLFTAGLDASWQIDLFGKIQRSVEAASAEMYFQENEAQFVRQTLLSDIARSYLRVRLLQNQYDLSQQSIAVQEQTAQLVEQRRKAGLSNQLDLAQTRSLQQRIMALQADLRQQLEVELNQLSILVGEAPSFNMRNFVGFAPIPTVPPMADVGFPAELLRRRPDVRREEALLAAAVARIGVAEADLYPQLSLLGTIEVSAQNMSDLFESDSLDFGVGPSLRWNILHFGRITSNIAVQESQCRQAFHAYQKTVIEASREVEDALARHQSFRAQMSLLNQAVEADRKAVELSLERYDAGKANFQRFLDAQQQLVLDLQNRAQTQANAVEQLIRLYNALGGTWQPGNGIPIEFSQVQFTEPVVMQQNAETILHSQPMQEVIQGSQTRELPPQPIQQQIPQQQIPQQQFPQQQFPQQQFPQQQSFSPTNSRSILQQQPSNDIPLPAPLPSPEAFDGFPKLGDEELLGLPPSKPNADFLDQKVPHKFPEP